MRVAALAAVLVVLGCGPIGWLSGGRLTGEVVLDPVEDWSFSDAHPLIQVEVRPEFPHSVTTICFQHDGSLYVPARRPLEKKWTYYVTLNPLVRVRIGDRVYPLRAVRVDREEMARAAPAMSAKYDRPLPEGGVPDDVWFFRMDRP